jgi:hypothetical protein
MGGNACIPGNDARAVRLRHRTEDRLSDKRPSAFPQVLADNILAASVLSARMGVRAGLAAERLGRYAVFALFRLSDGAPLSDEINLRGGV